MNSLGMWVQAKTIAHTDRMQPDNSLTWQEWKTRADVIQDDVRRQRARGTYASSIAHAGRRFAVESIGRSRGAKVAVVDCVDGALANWLVVQVSGAIPPIRPSDNRTFYHPEGKAKFKSLVKAVEFAEAETTVARPRPCKKRRTRHDMTRDADTAAVDPRDDGEPPPPGVDVDADVDPVPSAPGGPAPSDWATSRMEPALVHLRNAHASIQASLNGVQASLNGVQAMFANLHSMDGRRAA